MRGLHFLTTDGVEFIGLNAAVRAHCAAAVALPGEFVGLAEDLDHEASMRKLVRDQQLLVEFGPLRVRDVWITVDHFGDAGVLWSEYEFEGIEGRFRGDAFIDARFAGSATGALVPYSGQLLLVPLIGELRDPAREFGEPIPIGGLERAARHRVLGSLSLDEYDSADYRDTLVMDQITPVWGRAEFVHGQDRLDLLGFAVWDAIDHQALAEVTYALECQASSMRR